MFPKEKIVGLTLILCDIVSLYYNNKILMYRIIKVFLFLKFVYFCDINTKIWYNEIAYCVY